MRRFLLSANPGGRDIAPYPRRTARILPDNTPAGDAEKARQGLKGGKISEIGNKMVKL